MKKKIKISCLNGRDIKIRKPQIYILHGWGLKVWKMGKQMQCRYRHCWIWFIRSNNKWVALVNKPRIEGHSICTLFLLWLAYNIRICFALVTQFFLHGVGEGEYVILWNKIILLYNQASNIICLYTFSFKFLIIIGSFRSIY